MMNRVGPILAAVLLLGSHVTAADQGPVPAAPAPIPPDLLVFGAGGLQLGGTSLFADAVDGAAYDDAQDLIWFASKGTLQVIDLRAAVHPPIVIAKQLPGAGFQIDGFSHAEFGTTYTNVYMAFELGKKPKVAPVGAVYEVVDPDAAKALKKKIKKVKIVGGAWIAAQQGRTPKPAVAPPARPTPPKVVLPRGTAKCDDGPDSCGEAQWLATTPLELVAVQYACGDACFTGCVLYDPVKKQFAPLLDDGEWGALTDSTSNASCMDIALEPGNGHYFGGGTKVCSLGAKKMTCVDLGAWTPFAWVTAPAAAAAPAPAPAK